MAAEESRALRKVRSAGVACLTLLMACSQESFNGTLLEPLDIDQDDIHIIGTSDALARIEDLMPAADGAVWALNNTEPFLVLLSAEGEELRLHGERGGGPGEFSWPSTLVRDPSTGAVWVYDIGLGKLVRVPEGAGAGETVSLAGASSAAVRLNSYEYLWMSNGGRAWIQGTEDGFVFAQPSPAMPWIFALWSTDVVRLQTDGQAEQVLSTAEIVGEPSARFASARRFLPYPIWTACPNGSLAVYDPNQNLLRRFSASGEMLVVHELPPEQRVRITTERIFTTVYPGVLRNRLVVDPPERDVFYEMVRRDYEDREAEFSPVFPEYVHLDCSIGDTLWLQLFDSTGGQMGRGPFWLRVTAEGKRGEVRFPASFRPMRFHEGQIWGVHTGEFDVEYVAWTEMAGP